MIEREHRRRWLEVYTDMSRHRVEPRLLLLDEVGREAYIYGLLQFDYTVNAAIEIMVSEAIGDTW